MRHVADHPANEGYCLTQSAKKHVFLVEDDPATLRALTRMLHHLEYTVHAFAGVTQFLSAPRDCAPAVLVTDMRLGSDSGLTLQGALRSDQCGMPVVFISGETTTRETVLAMKQGAHDFLAKPVTAKALVASIESALALHAEAVGQQGLRVAAAQRLALLSPREREVFWLLARGLNNAQLVERLAISLPTAKQYKSEVMRKLDLHSLAALIEFSTWLDSKEGERE